MRAACGVDGMKHFLGMDVFAAARLRLEEIFDNFERVYVSFSGGKDSGVAVQYALQIAREKGRLPLDVLHVDLPWPTCRRWKTGLPRLNAKRRLKIKKPPRSTQC